MALNINIPYLSVSVQYIQQMPNTNIFPVLIQEIALRIQMYHLGGRWMYDFIVQGYPFVKQVFLQDNSVMNQFRFA